MQYYKITCEITNEIWQNILLKYSNKIYIEFFEKLQLLPDIEQRKIVVERFKNPPSEFENLLPEYVTVTMRPLFLKQADFSLVYGYFFENSPTFSGNMKWVEDEFQLRSFIIKSEHVTEFLYTPGEAIILLGKVELIGFKNRGVTFKKVDISLNDLIG